jgi:hypothetical protein
VIFLTSKDAQIDELFGLKMGRRFHPQTILATAPGRAGQGRAPPNLTERWRRAEEWQQRSFGAWTAAHGPGAPHLHLERRTGSAQVTEFLTLQALVSRLRKKLKASDGDFNLIETLYGVAIISGNCLEHRYRRRCDAHSSSHPTCLASGLFSEPAAGRLSLALRYLVGRHTPNPIFVGLRFLIFLIAFLTLRHGDPLG